MATLQKIRNRGPLLVAVIGIALFAFVAGDAWKAIAPHQGRQDVGEVNGEAISAQDYQALVDERAEVAKMISNVQALGDEELTRIKDQVWESYINNKLIETEAQKLGLQVTDAEVMDVIEQGVHPLLMQTPFRNPQTGAFDKDMLKQFLVEYKQLTSTNTQLPAQYVEYYRQMGSFWNFIEKTLKQSLLADKYQSLIAKSILSNPVAAEDAFAGRSLQTDVLLAAIPYSAVTDTTLTVSKDEIKALYNKQKEMYKQAMETRDIKYIDVQVIPSDEDRAELFNEVTEYAGQLKETTEMAAFIRSTGSTVPFTEVAINKSKYPSDIATRIDSVQIGQVFGPYYNAADDSYNAMMVIKKEPIADEIEYRQIQVYAETSAKTKELADSIYTALRGGSNFEEVAKVYGQTGQSNTLKAGDYEGAALNGDNAKFIKALINARNNELVNLELGQVNVILQVLNKKDVKDKYQVAVIKRPVEFSKETYNKAYNNFSQFVAQNKTLDKLVENAEENGYRLLERADFRNSEHNVGGVKNTREALKWVFEASEGEVSPLYECGENDHLMVVALEKINPAGYRNINSVADMLRMEILRDKKAEKILAELKGASIDQIKGMANAVSDTVKLITFNAPAYVSVTRASEPVLGGVASVSEVNKVSAPVKGNAGVYVMQVINKENNAEEFNAQSEESVLKMMATRYASTFINDLYEKANVKDNRYLYF